MPTKYAAKYLTTKKNYFTTPNNKHLTTHPAVCGLYATFPAKTTGTMISAATTTTSFVCLCLGSLPRLNLSSRSEIGNNDMTHSQTSENISEMIVRLAPAVAYSIPLKAAKQSTDTYGDPIRGMRFRKNSGSTRCRANCCNSSHALSIP